MKRAISSIAILPLLLLAGPTRHRAIPSGQAHAAASSAQPSVEEIRAELIEGNKRFVAGHRKASDLVAVRRTLAAGQHPKVAVLACSDSRVAPELIFDQGLGDLFVVRSAGNVVDPVAIGSIEYAVEHLGSRVIVVLGHTKCGAVTAACSREKMPSANLQAIVDRIDPAVERAARYAKGDQLVEAAIQENVHQSAKDLMADSEILRHFVHDGKLTVLQAEYELGSGKVVWLDASRH